jgi:hypothetical protein
MFQFRRKALAVNALPLQHCQLKNYVLYNSHSMSLINHVLYNLNSLNIEYIDYMNLAIVRKCEYFLTEYEVLGIVHLIEVFLIAMIYIMYIVSLVASRLVIRATHLILALVINRRYY